MLSSHAFADTLPRAGSQRKGSNDVDDGSRLDDGRGHHTSRSYTDALVRTFGCVVLRAKLDLAWSMPHTAFEI